MSNVSFLPEDYVAQAAERRTNLISLVLFGVVMTAVFGAFLVTNRQWTQVRTEQMRINGDTESAAADIRKMQELELKRGQMIEKAELAMTLIEPVPRSVLLALLVNAMPERLSLLDFDLKSEEIKKPRKVADKDKPADGKAKPAQAPKVANRGKTKTEAEASKDAGKDEPKPEAVHYLIAISMTGVAPSDLEVSRYMNALAAIPILRSVRLETTEEKEVDGMIVRQFRIAMRIDPDADIRSLKQGIAPPDNPMDDRMRLAPPPLAQVGAPGTESEPEGGAAAPESPAGQPATTEEKP